MGIIPYSTQVVTKSLLELHGIVGEEDHKISAYYTEKKIGFFISTMNRDTEWHDNIMEELQIHGYHVSSLYLPGLSVGYEDEESIQVCYLEAGDCHCLSTIQITDIMGYVEKLRQLYYRGSGYKMLEKVDFSVGVPAGNEFIDSNGLYAKTFAELKEYLNFIELEVDIIRPAKMLCVCAGHVELRDTYSNIYFVNPFNGKKILYC